MTSVYLVRHAQAQGNLENRFQGHTDLPLTPEGEAQAKKLTRRFAAIPLQKVYVSPLARTAATAAGIARSHGLTPQVEPGLIEINGGELENLLFDDIARDHAELYRHFMEEPHNYRSRGGETFEEVTRRMRDTVCRLAAENPNSNILLLTHGCAIRCFLAWAQGYTVEEMAPLPWGGNTGVSHLLFLDDGSIRIAYIHDTSHLLREREGQVGQMNFVI